VTGREQMIYVPDMLCILAMYKVSVGTVTV